MLQKASLTIKTHCTCLHQHAAPLSSTCTVNQHSSAAHSWHDLRSDGQHSASTGKACRHASGSETADAIAQCPDVLRTSGLQAVEELQAMQPELKGMDCCFPIAGNQPLLVLIGPF